MSVYFAQAGRYTKIGYSADPASRVSSVTTHGTRPADLRRGTEARLLGWIPGNMRRELEVHGRFVGQRVEGEWFVLDVAEVRELIWADPCGIDIQRMSAMAVLAAIKYPEATRDDLAAAGIPIAAVPLDEAMASLGRLLGGAA